MSSATPPKVTAIAPWFGSNRMLAPAVGEELRGCKWVGVPFAGGMSELVYIKASSIVVGDLHRHVINLARVIADPAACDRLATKAIALPFHPDVLAEAQGYCLAVEADAGDSETWALMYFICCWMGRSAKAGIDDEFRGGLPVRWSATGGDSNTRYRSAIESLRAWQAILARCNFVCQDVAEFLGNVKDDPSHGLYLDPPFPGPGDAYRHKFPEVKHRRLAARLSQFKHVRIVCRFYDHPLIAELYPEGPWRWRRLEGRKQTNGKAPELLIVNGPAF